MAKMVWWKVMLDGEEIDKVPYDESYKSADEVKRSLVNHDGYDPAIEVKRERPYNYGALDRAQCVELLENVSIQCYDSESVEELREAVEANVDDGTISPDDLP